MKIILPLLALLLTAPVVSAVSPTRSVSGQYLEVRSCDVYTGPCVANAEMGLAGREGMLVWSIQRGTWEGGVRLDGLTVIAVLQAGDTLGDVRYQPRAGRAVVLVDEKATPAQHAALVSLVKAQTGAIIRDIVRVQSAPITVAMGACKSGACASVKAGDLLEISTRCLGGKDHLCGNEENFYPPLTGGLAGAFAAFTELAAFRGRDLNTTWELTGTRSAYLASFRL